MFESTLEAQGLHEGERSFGPLSVAVLAHVGIGVTILAVTALIVPPVRPPDMPPPVFVTLPPIPLGDRTPPAADPGPKKGSESAKPNKAVVAPPVPQPTPPLETPDTLRALASHEAPTALGDSSDESVGDPNGSRFGVPDGTGTGTGTGSSPYGTGDDSEPSYVTPEMERPRLLEKVEPQYPDAARRIRLAGRVTVRAVIGQDGSVESAEIAGSTNPLFDQAALGAVRKWRYSPALMNGKPVRVYFTVVVTFVLR